MIFPPTGFHQEGDSAFEDESEEQKKDTSEESSTKKETDEDTASSDQDDKKEGDDDNENDEDDDTGADGESDDEDDDDKGDEDDSTGTKEEKDVPFHKNPRFKEIIKERNTLRDTIKTQDERLEKLETLVTDGQKDDAQSNAPDWFISVYGDNPKLWEQYRTHTAKEREGIRDEIRDEIRAEQKSESKKVDDANSYINDAIQELRDEGLKFDKNALEKIALEYRPMDDDGNIDFRKAYEILSMQKGKKTKEKVDAKKKVASKTGVDRKSDNSKSKGYTTSEDIRNKGFGDLV